MKQLPRASKTCPSQGMTEGGPNGRRQATKLQTSPSRALLQ